MIERGFGEGFGVKARQDVLAALQHVNLQVAFEARDLPLAALDVLAAQLALLPQPVAQSCDRDLQDIADEGGVAVMLVNLVEGVYFGVQRIPPRHGRSLAALAGRLTQRDAWRSPSGWLRQRLALRPRPGISSVAL